MKPTKKKLEQLYVKENKNMKYISEKYGTYRRVVSGWLKEYGIPVNNPHKKKDIPDKKILISLYNDGKRLSDISKIYGASENLVSKWFKHYNIKVKLITERTYDIPSKTDLVKLYNDERLTIKQISGHYNVSFETVRRWFVYHKIKTRSNQRKYQHLRTIPLTKQQQDYLIGVMLGDGHLSRKTKKRNARLNINHSNKQFAYFLYNRNIFDNFVNNVYEIRRVDKRTGNEYHGWSFTSIKHPGMNKTHNMFYKNNKKIVPIDIGNYLNSFVMAIWIMDDGWLNRETNMRLSTDGFTKRENEILSFAIKSCFNINNKVIEYCRNDKKYYYLSLNKENSIKLSKLVYKHIIPEMRYKLVRSSTTECQTPKKDDDTV